MVPTAGRFAQATHSPGHLLFLAKPVQAFPARFRANFTSQRQISFWGLDIRAPKGYYAIHQGWFESSLCSRAG